MEVTGTVKAKASQEVLANLTVTLVEAGKQTSTDKIGQFRFSSLNAGTYTVRVTGIGWNPESRTVTVEGTGDEPLVIEMQESAKNMGEVIVYGASRQPEKLTTAPAAVSVVTPLDIENASSHATVAKTLEHLPGVDVVWSGANDFNVNARGFNNSINRRQLVLIDGRDPSTPMINLNEWNSLSSLLNDISTIEVVRGPGSALYGSNAYNGVINIRTTDPKEVQGTHVTLMGGEWQTFRGAVRHSGVFGDFAYKITAGAATQYNYSVVSRMRDTTKPNNGLEYPGLSHDIRPITDEDKSPYMFGGTARLDYYLQPTQRLVLEGGYTNSGNEIYANQTGRIIIQETVRPFARLAYNSERLNVQGYWTRRLTPQAQVVLNAPATSGEDANVFNIDAQYNETFLDDDLRLIVGATYERVNVITGFDYEVDSTKGERRLAFLDPDDQTGSFFGAYAQGEWQITDQFKFVGALRVDETNFDYPVQFSPKAAIVFEPMVGQTFRATYNRSWLRPSFDNLYRKSPAGAPVPGASVEARVDSITSALVGEEVRSNLGLGTSMSVWNLGNITIGPEKAHSFELGYRGAITDGFFVEVNAYWNRRTDLISNPLGGLAPDVYAPVRSNTGNAAYDIIADSVLNAQLAVYRQDTSRLSMYQNSPAFVITPTNIAVVDELGLEISATYFITQELNVHANYSYLDVDVSDNTVPQNKILPNTTPHRINVGAQYSRPGVVDARIDLRYVEGYDWIAGLYTGVVPSYAVVNLSAGYFVLPELRLGVNVFNLLDREHYEIFGGTILRRQVTGSVSYTF
jgi:outer membrane receptor for ferrienterochelin and colicins